MVGLFVCLFLVMKERRTLLSISFLKDIPLHSRIQLLHIYYWNILYKICGSVILKILKDAQLCSVMDEKRDLIIKLNSQPERIRQKLNKHLHLRKSGIKYPFYSPRISLVYNNIRTLLKEASCLKRRRGV